MLALLITLLSGIATVSLGASPAAAAVAPAKASHTSTSPAKTPSRAKAPSPAKAPSRVTPQQRAAAAKQAIAAATMPDTCSGSISPDTIYPCTSPSSTGTDTFTLSVNDTADVLMIRVLAASGSGLSMTLTAPDGSTVSCQEPNQLYECGTSQDGTYTLAVANGGSDYTVDYTELLSDTTCATADPSFDAATLTGSLAAGQSGTCYTLDMPSGDVLHINSETSNNAISVAVYDSAGTQVCDNNEGDCPLTGIAPYRVFVGSFYGETEDFQLQLNDITNPAGCQAAPQETYGQVPPSATDRCRTLTVTTAGSYQLSVAVANSGTLFATLYTQAGTSQCSIYGTTYCQLPVGTYDLVFDDSPR